VGGLLEEADVQVITPDLPSHRTPTAGLGEDAAEVRHAIQACARPVARSARSYGGSVISVAAAGEGSVSRLVYTPTYRDPPDFLAKILAGLTPIRMCSSTPTEDSYIPGGVPQTLP
jgi:hypothetical protein